jgi:hypothetical protein
MPVLLLTSTKLKSEINSKAIKPEVEQFFVKNKFNDTHQNFVLTLFEEANANKFLVILKKA